MLPKKTKLVLFWHLDITKQKILGKMFHGQNISLLKRADKIVATSPDYIEGSPYLSRFRKKCVVIPNCIRTERLKVTPQIQKKADELKEKYAGKTICFAIGRHIPYKGLTYLVQACKLLDDSFAVLIGGKGPLTESLMLEAEGDSKIGFLGRVSDDDLVAYYLACDIFAFPSITKNEAFGIALAEGMYFNNPAVTFKIPGSGVNYVNLKDVTGIECPNGDVEAFASALKKLRDDPKLRKQYGEAARNRVMDNFMYEQFKEHINNLIKDFDVKY
jgi:rhamnosyl/mannosyltransferase